MKRRNILLSALLLLFFALNLSAQAPSKITIKGSIKDTVGAEMSFATVMLLSPKDTTLVNFTRSDDKGAFAFKNVRNVPYLLKISYIGYLPHQQYLPAFDKETNDLGAIDIKPISKELMEVVIRTAKAPLQIRGDTIEYDASTFKVPPGSTVEDLLRRLPGIEVDADGNIKAQGKDIKRMYVDGKTFFGDDPKSATKNLGAETISKVQVYNEKSEQAKLTGVDDGKKEKAMNLELKDEYKKGSFGKITAAAGSSERWAGRASYNRFTKTQQFSFIGYGNNINQTGVNWEDYGEFKGQNSYSDFDNGDFGFSSGGGRYYMMGGDDVPMNDFDGRGFTKNAGAGLNYNYDNKKTKYNASYFYNQSALTLDQIAARQNFVAEGIIANTDTSSKYEFRGNHNINTRLQRDLDSNNILIVKANARFSNSNSSYKQSQLFTGADSQPSNSLNVNNGSDLNAWRLNTAAIFRHRFKKKGRSWALSTAYNGNNSDGTDQLFSLNRFFKANDFTEQVRQLNNNANRGNLLKASTLFTEPLAKKWFWETFANFSQNDNQVNRQVNRPDLQNQRDTALSVFFDNKTTYGRIGSSIRYSANGMNVTAGLAAQQISLDGRSALDRNVPSSKDPIKRDFNNLTPNVDFNYEFPNNKWLSAGYSYGIKEPQFNDLQPVQNVNNPAFIIQGNPNLDPERAHYVNFNFNSWNPASFSSIGIGSNATFYENRIVYNQTVELVDSVGVRTTTRPANASGGYQYDTYFWSNFPIIKTKLTMGINGGLNGGEAPSYVNGIENKTQTNGFNVNMSLNGTPTAKLFFELSGAIGFNKINYSIQKEQNQNIQNHTIAASIKWQFAEKFFIESNFNYHIYRNDRFNFNQDIPIWNASVRRLLGKTNRFELRLAAFDLLNRSLSINQSGSQNYVSNSIAKTLARYYMFSVSYNVRGYENKLKKNDWW
ncbi:MAG: TonB-dependent receptor [Bacteroidota bacterium]